MSNQLLASKITVEEEQPGIRAIPTLNTFVMGFLGTAKQGPVGTATLVSSFAEFVKIFGSYLSGSDLVSAVEGFFNDGGTSAWIVRTVHYSDITDASTKTSAAGTVNIADSAPATTLTINAKYDGTYAAGLKIRIAAATSGNAAEFNLSVEDTSGLTLETYPNLSMSTSSARFVETIVNDPISGSFRIAADAVLTTRPVNILSAALSGGADGLGSIADADYSGSAASATGLRAFDVVDDLTVLAVPGIATSAVHNAMLTYAESTRSGQVFAILDPPSGVSYSAMVTYVNSTAAIGGLSEFGAIYWPRIKVQNPSTAIYGNVTEITISPSGDIAGMMARNDNAKNGGVWTTPAGTEEGKLPRCVGVENTDVLKEEIRDVLFPQRINPITTMKGFPRFVDGARTLKASGNFPTIAQRRGVSFVERSVKLGLQFARHKNNTPSLRASLYRSVYSFLKDQMSVGAFASNDPATAFFVDFGDALNPPQQKNTIIGRIGIATVQPAEYIRLKFSQDTRAIDAALKG